jgi:hypothetical protein
MEEPMNRIGWLAAAALLLSVGACSGAPSGTSGQDLSAASVDRGLVGTHQGDHDRDAEREDAEAEHGHGDAQAEREDAEAQREHGDAQAEHEDAEVEHGDAEAEHQNGGDGDGDHGGRGSH